jgi:hypothetical protein
MKNVNEPRKTAEEIEDDVEMYNFDTPSRAKTEGEVISLEERRANMADSGNQLIQKRQLEDFRTRWTTIQAGFVDEPRKAVHDADELVSSAIQQITEGFRDQRGQLEKQWTQGNEASTEDLRLSLQRYRAFFERLLSL